MHCLRNGTTSINEQKSEMLAIGKARWYCTWQPPLRKGDILYKGTTEEETKETSMDSSQFTLIYSI